MDHIEAARVVGTGPLVGLFAHPTLPRAITVDAHGGLCEIDVTTGSVCGSAALALPASDPLVLGAALVVGRGAKGGLVATLGRGGTLATWDVEAQVQHGARTLKTYDKPSTRGADPSAVVLAGSQWAGAEGWLFVGRGAFVHCVRPHPLGAATDRQAADPLSPAASLTALACHPDRAWLCTALGHAPGEGPDGYEGEVRASLPTRASRAWPCPPINITP
jgi:hypothetical protein